MLIFYVGIGMYEYFYMCISIRVICRYMCVYISHWYIDYYFFVFENTYTIMVYFTIGLQKLFLIYWLLFHADTAICIRNNKSSQLSNLANYSWDSSTCQTYWWLLSFKVIHWEWKLLPCFSFSGWEVKMENIFIKDNRESTKG